MINCSNYRYYLWRLWVWVACYTWRNPRREATLGVDQQICCGFHVMCWFNTHEKEAYLCRRYCYFDVFCVYRVWDGDGSFVCEKNHKLPRCFLSVARRGKVLWVLLLLATRTLQELGKLFTTSGLILFEKNWSFLGLQLHLLIIIY